MNDGSACGRTVQVGAFRRRSQWRFGKNRPCRRPLICFGRNCCAEGDVGRRRRATSSRTSALHGWRSWSAAFKRRRSSAENRRRAIRIDSSWHWKTWKPRLAVIHAEGCRGSGCQAPRQTACRQSWIAAAPAAHRRGHRAGQPDLRLRRLSALHRRGCVGTARHRARRSMSSSPAVRSMPCRSCTDGVAQAAAPARLIPGGMPTEATVAHVLVSKYADHLPLANQGIYSRKGVDLDRSTLAVGLVAPPSTRRS